MSGYNGDVSPIYRVAKIVDISALDDKSPI